MHLRQAGVFDVKRRGLGQRQSQQNGQHHPDDAAVTNHRHGLAGMFAENLLEARFDAVPELLDRFGVGDGRLLQFVQPFKRFNLELFAHLLPAQPGPGAKINLTQAGQNRRRAPAVRFQWNERLLRALHRTDVIVGRK